MYESAHIWVSLKRKPLVFAAIFTFSHGSTGCQSPEGYRVGRRVRVESTKFKRSTCDPKMALLLWRISTRLHRPILLIEKHSKPPLPRIRVFLSTNVSELASITRANPTTCHWLSTRLYSSSTEDGSGEKLTFGEYRKLRKSLKVRARIAGLPMAFLGMGISSFVNVQLHPHMFNMTPEEVQPIL